MNKLDTAGKWIVAGVVFVIAVSVLAIYGWGRPSAPGTPTAGTPSGTNATTSTSTAGAATGTQSAPSAPKTNTGGGKTPAVSPIIFSTPIPGETWKISAQNLIAWSREGSVSGQIELLDATTKKLVGVILNQVGPHQTSYTWNTRDLYLSRTNPSKTTVLPGRYVIKISFDGNNLSPITSQPITLEQ